MDLVFLMSGLTFKISSILARLSVASAIFSASASVAFSGSEIIFKLCQFFNIDVIIIEEKEASFEHDLVSSVIEIITVFSSKLYGSRSHKNKKTVVATA